MTTERIEGKEFHGLKRNELLTPLDELKTELSYISFEMSGQQIDKSSQWLIIQTKQKVADNIGGPR